MRYRQQFDLTDCGAACLAMIASYFGKQVSVAQVREFTKTDTEGTKLEIPKVVLLTLSYFYYVFSLNAPPLFIKELTFPPLFASTY